MDARLRQRKSKLAPVARALERHALGRSALRWIRVTRSVRHHHLPRVLCVGFQKTGTSSLARAMRVLGYSHFGYDQDIDQEWFANHQIERCLKFASNFDALDDKPWSEPGFVRAFTHRFPGSRYVLLEREELSWCRSYRHHLLSLNQPVFDDPEDYLDLYRTHNRLILEILQPYEPLLIMNICAGDGFEKLCPFLGHPIPSQPFPWENARDPLTATR